MQNELTVYETGFHLNPSLPEGEVLGKVTDLKDHISSRGGVFISEGFPTLRPLTYTIVKRIGNENKRFNQSYFGWIKFEMTPEAIVDFKKVLENDNDIIRFLIIKTVREDTMISTRPEFRLPGEEKVEDEAGQSNEEEKEDLTPEEEAEIDRSIDDLVSSTDKEEENKQE
ncbi:MAG: hypothetical protein COV34_00560 [Candidatus Zambryskibacteria bacterium CG10_big_fil_rev_8_21_14_0_10_42_12]|uniref:Small ribosomal subunit protein bS6 n=1 Tax=Candidatus Zambryskibacteria bacterium CG10_big_fil_rev_8_21_14_0_10_42_12 TaxID=1975115 RepID=A0A2H0QX10_9BACT|nr:MAG: hypothetical protein COV34_00560 [Candidatus Zambryskibacteria bacterium CG10_big_fil_rev_8_21_14_0_10_42_12]